MLYLALGFSLPLSCCHSFELYCGIYAAIWKNKLDYSPQLSEKVSRDCGKFFGSVAVLVKKHHPVGVLPAALTQLLTALTIQLSDIIRQHPLTKPPSPIRRNPAGSSELFKAESRSTKENRWDCGLLFKFLGGVRVL